jgi:hypothetical protein
MLLCTVEMRREYKQENALLLIPQGCRESRLCCKHWKFHNDLQNPDNNNNQHQSQCIVTDDISRQDQKKNV